MTDKPFIVVSDAEAETADFVVCMRLETMEAFGVFPDNVIGMCSDCACQIFHRPHVPKTPPKICARCAFKRVMRERMTKR